jgi:ubiquinone/menaquinone biosynthesis C-methylase UbiE
VTVDDAGETGSTSNSRPVHDFEAMYESTPPWDIGRPQPAFDSLARKGEIIGKVLDVGCGTGEHALLAASFGHEALGIDAAPKAIQLAKKKAEERRLQARFVVWDALDLPSLDEHFDTVLDCGLFHVFDDTDRVRFVRSLSAVVPSAGHYHLLCFSDRQPGDWGPRRITEREIRESFSQNWQIESIEPTVLDITIDPTGAHAWLAKMARR